MRRAVLVRKLLKTLDHVFVGNPSRSRQAGSYCPDIYTDHRAKLVPPRFAMPSCLRSLLRRRPLPSNQLVHAALARLGLPRNPRFAAPCVSIMTQNQPFPSSPLIHWITCSSAVTQLIVVPAHTLCHPNKRKYNVGTVVDVDALGTTLHAFTKIHMRDCERSTRYM